MASSNNRRLKNNARALAKAENISYQQALHQLQTRYEKILDDNAKELFHLLGQAFDKLQAQTFWLSLTTRHYAMPDSPECFDLSIDHWFSTQEDFNNFLQRIKRIYGNGRNVFVVSSWPQLLQATIEQEGLIPTMIIERSTWVTMDQLDKHQQNGYLQTADGQTIPVVSQIDYCDWNAVPNDKAEHKFSCDDDAQGDKPKTSQRVVYNRETHSGNLKDTIAQTADEKRALYLALNGYDYRHLIIREKFSQWLANMIPANTSGNTLSNEEIRQSLSRLYDVFNASKNKPN